MQDLGGIPLEYVVSIGSALVALVAVFVKTRGMVTTSQYQALSDQSMEFRNSYLARLVTVEARLADCQAQHANERLNRMKVETQLTTVREELDKAERKIGRLEGRIRELERPKELV